MIRRLLSMVNKRFQGMHEAAILLGVFSLVSQLIGLARDRMLAHTIGPSATLDTYYAAFRIPDLIFLSVASLASITVLMPFIVSRMDSGGKESAKAFFDEVLSGFFLLLVLVSGAVFVLMPYLARFVAPGFAPAELAQLVTASRIMLLSPIFIGLSNMLGTVTQLMRKFFIFSLSPIFYNLGIVIGIIFFYPRFGTAGLAGGVALGAVLHVLVQLPTVVQAGFAPRLLARWKAVTLRQVAGVSLPRTLGLSMNSIALLVIMAMGSTLGAGSISIFNFAFNLETVPVGIIGVSYSVAVFPILAEAFSRGRREEWQSAILSAVRQVVFWSLPLMALLIVVRAQIVRVTLGSGAFSWSDTRLTAACLALFAVGLVAQNLVLVSTRAFYAAHNTKTPLVINACCSVLIVGLAAALLGAFGRFPFFRYFMESLLRVDGVPGTEVLMLPLAYSVGTLLNALLHWIDMRRTYLTSAGNLPRTLFEALGAAFAVGITAYGMLAVLARVFSLETFWGVLLQGGIASLAGALAGAGLLLLLKSETFLELVAALRKKFWKVDLVTSEEPKEK